MWRNLAFYEPKYIQRHDLCIPLYNYFTILSRFSHVLIILKTIILCLIQLFPFLFRFIKKLKKVVYFVQFLSDIFIIKFCNIRSFPRIFKDQTCVTRASLWPHITRHTRLVLLFICSFNFHLSHCRSIKADWALNRKWLQTATCHSIQK